MNVLQNLMVFYNHLSPDSTYRNVCEGILGHLNEVAEGTIYDLAELTHSSRTTIWRMIHKLGYKSFSDFHFELRRSVEKYTYYNRILPAKDCTTSESIKNSLLTQMTNACANMRKHLKTEAMEKVAELLFKADKVRFYIPFHSSSIYSLQQNLAMSGKNTAYYCLMPEILEDTKLLTKDSIVFINTIEHVETMNLQPIFENIKKQAANILGLTTRKSKYKAYIDWDIFDEETEKVAEGVMIFDMYFYMLSEIYRMKYIRR